MSEFLTLYPGQYLPQELDGLKEILAQVNSDLQRKDFSFQQLVETSGGQSRGVPYMVSADPEEIQQRMKALDPLNPIWFDLNVAKAAGLEALPAPEGWTCPKGGYFGGMSRIMGDITCVKEHHHYCTYHAPVYQGDTLYPVLIDQDIWDATPYEGSQWRTWALRGTAKVYNQHGQLVMTQTCGVEECFKIYADPEKRTWSAQNMGVEEPEFANHPIHHYTDEDWQLISSLWEQEHIQGSQPLYWEDVEVGHQPPVTVDGPYTCPGKGGMVMSVSAPSKSCWYIRQHWGEPELQLSRDDFGVYHVDSLDKEEAGQRKAAMEAMMKARPHPKPVGDRGPKKEDPSRKSEMDNSPVAVRGKATMDNFTGRDSALRCIHNWIGHSGRIVNLSWCIGATGGQREGIPCHPNRVSPFKNVPGMEHRHTEVHGEEGDISINRIYVTGKRIADNGDHLVDITWWCETIDHQIHTEGTATVLLPSRP